VVLVDAGVRRCLEIILAASLAVLEVAGGRLDAPALPFMVN
jgi:hypothetical protein